ncbi:restriction endonuclease subunit S [uncultured Aggregatibacter sp.]|uniref:restriction endonuclease subunit S n=1 Tax=uncultured Aggregatibacter sp. TaxID=470564 RepID=UPI0025E0134B|nr:restriction endonuclease subunit S [uncultured Aggregatibacter sp.]
MSDNFKTDTLDSLCELIVDCPHSTPTWTTFGYVVIRNQNITDGVLDLSSPSYTDYSGYRDRTKRASPQENDIVITREAPMGRVCLIPKEPICCLGQRQVLLRADRNKISSEYLYWSLRSPFVQRQILINEGTGATVSNMRIPVLKALEIPRLASIEIENKKARDLSNIQNKIQLNTQINQTLEQIAQALFKSWFVDFDPVRAKVQALSDGLSLEQAELAAMQAISGKTPEELTALSQTQPDRYAELAEIAKEFPCEMVEVDGVEVPKGWEVKELGSLMTIKRGGSPRPIKDFISDKGLNWVKISDATAEDNPFLFSTKEYIKSEGLSKTVLLKKGSLILSNSATSGLPRFLELDACIHDGWLYFSNIKRLTQEYLYFFFLNIRNNLIAQGNGSVFTNLKTDIVKAQKTIVPDEKIMYYFDSQIKSIMNLIRYKTANSISLKETRDLLLPELLNGGV